MSDTQFVDPNTDDLDAFDDLLSGRAQVKEESTPEATPEDQPVEEDALEEIEDDRLANEEEVEEADDGAGEPEPEAKPKKLTVQDRINELTRARREAERREADTKRQLDEIIAKLNQAPEAKAPVQKTVTVEGPSPDDVSEDGSEKYPLGEFDPAYIRDLTRFTIRTETEAAKAEDQRLEQVRQIEAARNELASEWAVKLEAAREVYDNLDEKLVTFEATFRDLDPAYGEYLANTIMSLEYGPDVLNYLADNVAEAKRIAASGAAKATIALGRLEARFVKDAEPPKKKVSSAPTPPSARTKGNAARVSIPDDTDDLDAFAEKFFAKRP